MTTLVYVEHDDDGRDSERLAAAAPALDVRSISVSVLGTAAVGVELGEATCAVLSVDCDEERVTTAVEQLRAAGFDGPLVLFGDARRETFERLLEATGAHSYVSRRPDADVTPERDRRDGHPDDEPAVEREGSRDEATWRRLGEAVERVVAGRDRPRSEFRRPPDHEAMRDLIGATTLEEAAAAAVLAVRGTLGLEAAVATADGDGALRVRATTPGFDRIDSTTLPAGLRESVERAGVRTFDDPNSLGVDDIDWGDPRSVAVSLAGESGVLVAGSVDGRLRPSELDAARSLGRSVGIALDRVGREMARREEHDRIAALFENTSDAIVDVEYVDGEPVVRDANGAFERIFGVEAAGSDADPFDVSESLKTVAGAFTPPTVADEPFEREVRQWTERGVRDFLLRVVPFGGANPTRGYAIYTDITERKRIERALGRLHETTRDLVRADTDGEIADITVAAASDILGYPLVSLRVYDPETETLELRGVSAETEALLGPQPTDGPAVGIAYRAFKTGEAKIVENLSAYGVDDIDCAMYFPLGERGLLTLGATEPDAFDAAGRRLAQILAANVEVALDRAEWTRLLRERERELGRQNTRLDEFASVVSHDLRNPLSVARGFFDIVRERCEVDENPELREHAERVERAHERMNRLITDLLALAREGRAVGATELVGLGATARSAWRAVETGDAVFEVLENRTLQADAERLNTLFENLFRNAVEHGETGPSSHAQEEASPAAGTNGDETGTLRVRVGALEDGFFVEDNGPGIPESERASVFDRGYTTSDDGTGFGLSIVRGIVDAHGWEITTTNGLFGGARFEVTGLEETRREGE